MEKEEIFGQKTKLSEVSISSGSKFIGATFLYLAFALLVSFATAGILGLLFSSVLTIDSFIILMLFALIAYIPVMIWVNVSCLVNGKSIGPAFFTYSIVMGFLISPLVLVVDIGTVLTALGVTALTFALIALIAFNTKKNLNSLAIFASGLLSGLLILFLIDLVLSFFIIIPTIDIVVSVGFFVVVLLIATLDLNHVKRVAMNGGAGKNYAMMCALNLYVDFIYIFIRFLIIIASMKNRS